MRSQSTGLIDRTLCELDRNRHRSEARQKTQQEKQLIINSPHSHICCINRCVTLQPAARPTVDVCAALAMTAAVAAAVLTVQGGSQAPTSSAWEILRVRLRRARRTLKTCAASPTSARSVEDVVLSDRAVLAQLLGRLECPEWKPWSKCPSALIVMAASSR